MTNQLNDWYLHLGNLTIEDVLSSVKFIKSCTSSGCDGVPSHLVKGTYDI